MTDPTLLDLMGVAEAPPPAPPEEADGWQDHAYHALRLFAKTTEYFKAEDLRKHARERGLQEPPDPRAWGAVFLRAERDGLIAQVGYAKSKSRIAHGRPALVWQVK